MAELLSMNLKILQHNISRFEWIGYSVAQEQLKISVITGASLKAKARRNVGRLQAVRFCLSRNLIDLAQMNTSI